MHHVAERFVDANPVLVNRKSLRCACHRRSDKPPKLHVRLEWISRHFTDNDARHVLLQGIRDVQRMGALDLVYVNNIDACWNLIDINPRTRTRYRRRGVYHASWQGPHGARRILVLAASNTWRCW